MSFTFKDASCLLLFFRIGGREVSKFDTKIPSSCKDLQ